MDVQFASCINLGVTKQSYCYGESGSLSRFIIVKGWRGKVHEGMSEGKCPGVVLGVGGG